MQRQEVLSQLRSILRLIKKNYGSRSIWREQVLTKYRASSVSTQTNPQDVERLQKDADDLHAYLRSTFEYKTLMERYWPAAGLSNEEKLKRTAGVVGLAMPKTFVDGGSASASS